MRWLKTLGLFSVTLIFILSINIFVEEPILASSDESSTSVDTYVFPHNQVIDVNIDITEENLELLKTQALNETSVIGDITYNGYTINSVAIRPKGNSSLRSVANTDSERFSLKIDFDAYVDHQNLFGITKLNLNNIFSDETMMKEYLAYESLQSIDATASRTTFVALSINGEYFGLYLAVEQVDEAFLEENFQTSDGDLYKPDMGIGSDLAYISEDINDYLGLYPEDSSNPDDATMLAFITAIDDVNNAVDEDAHTQALKPLDRLFDVDSFLKYLAMSTLTVHLDSYQGGMYHNYYLYLENGQFQWITWDLNMTFNGFMGSTDSQAIAFLIDEPVSGAMTSYPLVEAVLSSDTYLEIYHNYLVQLMEGYYEDATFTGRVSEVYEMIKDYVANDPSKFSTYEAFESALFESNESSLSLTDYVKSRNEQIQGQLDGSLASTNNGQGNAGTGKDNMEGGKPGGANNQAPDALANVEDVNGTQAGRRGIQPDMGGDQRPGQVGANAAVGGGKDMGTENQRLTAISSDTETATTAASPFLILMTLLGISLISGFAFILSKRH